MDKTNRAKALIEFYRSINPSVVNDWNIVNEIKNDLEIYLNSYSYEEMKKNNELPKWFGSLLMI